MFSVWATHRSAAPPRSRASQPGRVPRHTPPRALTQRGTKGTVGSTPRILGFPLLLRFELLAEDRGNLPLHERPRDGRISQRALLSARTVNLKTTTVLFHVLIHKEKERTF